MNSITIYKIISRVYDLLDVIYFRKTESSPRKAVIDYIPKGEIKILDVCTGTATAILDIAKARPEVKLLGIDRSKEMIEIARKKIDKNRINNVNIKECDATNTGFEDEEFNVVLISLVLHEIDYELARQILEEAYRVLRNDGTLIVTEWEESKSLMKRALFFPIKKLEPKRFIDFMKLDIQEYFQEFKFELEEISHCDYSKVIKLSKSTVMVSK